MTTKIKQTIRQGDVLLTRVDSVPAGLENKIKTIPAESGLIILARGEVTGHHHSIPADAVARFVLNETTMERFLEIREPTVISHQEHGPVEVPAGVFSVSIQREYRYGSAQTVAD